jgi:Family of unknown function (DUF6677)
MVTETPLTEKDSNLNPVVSAFIALGAWIVPGLGHLCLRRWGRALAFFTVVAGLAVAGRLMRGEFYTPHSSDAFGTLGFLADASAGVLYFLPRVLGSAGPDLSHAAGSYGARFIAAAGIVNLLSVLDAFGIARGRRD